MAEDLYAKDFSEHELNTIEKRALYYKHTCLNESWQRAYGELAYACNVLHAFMRRCTVEGSIADDSDDTPCVQGDQEITEG